MLDYTINAELAIDRLKLEQVLPHFVLLEAHCLFEQTLLVAS